MRSLTAPARATTGGDHAGTRRPGSSRRGARVLTWMERLFVVGGAAALAWCVFVVSDAYIVQRQARRTIESMALMKTPRPRSSSAPSSVARGTPLAELSIPRVGLRAAVLHGSDAHTLRLGLGHIESTPLPGESGNVAIAGHRDSFFRPLRNIQVGDDILLDTPQQRVHYRVSSFRVVNSYEVSVISPTRDPMLTLVTCYPFWFIGQAPDRFVVRAARVESPADAAPRSAAPRTGGPQSHEAQTDPLGVSSQVKGGANDDAARVREAVAHLRLTYNARRARHGETGADGLMTFDFCEVAVSANSATATCDAAPRPPESPSSTIWTFRLGRMGGEWTITSVGTR